MSKSNRTCYFTNRKELWSPRPMRWQASNKRNKVLCHRIERAQKKALIYCEVSQYKIEIDL